MRHHKIRHQFYLDQILSDKLEEISRRTSKSEIIARAVISFLEHRGENELDKRYGIRLDRLSRDLSLVRRDLEICIESLALFIRFVITLNAHTPAPDQATQAIAQERYLNFIDQVGKHVANGNSSFNSKRALQ